MEVYKHWKWSNGTKLKKTLKKENNEENQKNTLTEKKELTREEEFNMKINAQNIDKKELDKINKFVEFEQIHIEPNNRRTETSERMSSRHMIIQKPINPFLKDSDYLNDLNIQDTMLRPKDSNFNKCYLEK